MKKTFTQNLILTLNKIYSSKDYVYFNYIIISTAFESLYDIITSFFYNDLIQITNSTFIFFDSKLNFKLLLKEFQDL